MTRNMALRSMCPRVRGCMASSCASDKCALKRRGNLRILTHAKTRKHLRDKILAVASPTRPLYKTARWRRLRDSILKSNPVCAECAKNGRFVPANEVHHTLRARDNPESFFDASLLVGLCKSCHSKETGRERAEARQAKAILERLGDPTDGPESR